MDENNTGIPKKITNTDIQNNLPDEYNNTQNNPENGTASDDMIKTHVRWGKFLVTKWFFAILLFSVIVTIFFLLFFIVKTSNKSAESDSRRNERIEQIIDTGDKSAEELNTKREMILLYAQKNNISVSDSEVQARKEKLIKESGQQSIDAELASKRWSVADWEDIIKWQILREKILSRLESYRVGELIMVRWDSYVPEVTNEFAQKSSLAAKDFLNSIIGRFNSGEISNLKNAYDEFQSIDNVIFTGSDTEYYIQYTGIGSFGAEITNDELSGYYRFNIDSGSSNFEIVNNLPLTGFSEVLCDQRACYLYRITGGSDGGTKEEQDVLNALRDILVI